MNLHYLLKSGPPNFYFLFLFKCPLAQHVVFQYEPKIPKLHNYYGSLFHIFNTALYEILKVLSLTIFFVIFAVEIHAFVFYFEILP